MQWETANPTKAKNIVDEHRQSNTVEARARFISNMVSVNVISSEQVDDVMYDESLDDMFDLVTTMATTNEPHQE